MLGMSTPEGLYSMASTRSEYTWIVPGAHKTYNKKLGGGFGHCRKVRTRPQRLSYYDDVHPFCVYNILASVRIFVSILEEVEN